jgi:hemerythrin
MAILTWSDDLLTGNELVDMQHRGFYVILWDMISKSGMGNNIVDLGPFVADITKYALFHFRSEEAFMDRVEYPYKQVHVMEHDAFLERWSSLLARYHKEGDNSAMVLRFVTEVAEWLQMHIKGHDMKLAQWVREASPHIGSKFVSPEN